MGCALLESGLQSVDTSSVSENAGTCGTDLWVGITYQMPSRSFFHA